MNGATLPAPSAGNLLSGALTATATAGVRKPGAPGDNAQQADFSAFLALVSGAGFVPPAPTFAPAIPATATREDAQVVPAFKSAEPLPLLRVLMQGGRSSPSNGNSLPPGAPLAATGRDIGQAATSVAATGLSNSSAGGAATGLPDALTPVLATPTQAAALPTRWTHALLAAERDEASGDVLVTASHDSVLASDALLATANGARAAAPPATVALPTNTAQQPAFEQALGERLAWLVQEGRHDARIKLHPAELGSIDIRLSLDGDSTRISLASPHAAVRDALEQSVPRLRELLGSAGLDLSQVSVGTGDARSHGDFGRPTPSPTRGEHFAPADDAEVSMRTLAIRLPQGLVDTFA